jgi:hypothetical protein
MPQYRGMHAGPLNTAVRDLEALLPASPDAYPHNLDIAGGRVLVVRLDERGYRNASFLDDRMLAPSTQGAWLPGAAVTEASRRVRDARPVHFIFHAGHVGSTLLSRLLDECAPVLSLREPILLRTIAEAHDALGRPESLLSETQFEALVDMTLRLWSRGYAGTRAIVVKATSSAGRLAPVLLARAPASRAVYLNVAAEPYLATLLGGANSATDLRGHGAGRMRRLLAGRDLAVQPLHALSPGELAALGWLVESLSRRQAIAEHGVRVLALDFDVFLADVAGTLARVAGHFGLAADAATIEAAAAGPVLRQYSKAPQLPFPPGERAARLGESRRENRAEIAKGLAWLERMARADATIASLLAGERA